MLIRVMYPNGDYDMVRNDVLDRLVAKKRVKKFLRSGGWVDIDWDDGEFRIGSGSSWGGADRRTPRSH